MALSSHFQEPPSTKDIPADNNSISSTGTPPSPIFSLTASTPSPSASLTSQLSPCSTKENYDPTEKIRNQIKPRQNFVNVSNTKDIATTKDISLQLSIVPLQFNHDISTTFQNQPSLSTKRRKRNTLKVSKIARCNLSVIERHKKLGEGALDKLKNEVQAYAVDHTYKETARKFGIHHSTVSGWIKQSSAKQNQFNSCEATTIGVHKPSTEGQPNYFLNACHLQSDTNTTVEIREGTNCSCQKSSMSEKMCKHNNYAVKVKYKNLVFITKY